MDKQEQGELRQQPELEGPRGRWRGPRTAGRRAGKQPLPQTLLEAEGRGRTAWLLTVSTFQASVTLPFD